MPNRATRSWAASRSCPSDRKSTGLNSSHQINSYAVFCLKKKTSARGDPVSTRRPHHPSVTALVAGVAQGDPATARCLFLKYPFAAHSSKSRNLGLGVLFLHRDASITDMHDCDFLLPFSFILQYIFAARNASR